MTNAEKKVMYLGPNIRGVVKNGDVFEGGLPKRLSKIVEQKPIVKNMIVPLSDIVEAKNAINQEGTVEAVSYDKIEAIPGDEIKKILEGE